MFVKTIYQAREESVSMRKKSPKEQIRPTAIVLQDLEISNRNLILRYAQEAKAIALKSLRESQNSVHVGAVLLNSNLQKVGEGANNMKKTHRRLLSYYPFPYLHAESSAIIKSGLRTIEDGIIIVARIGLDGRGMNCRPCEYCQQFMYDHGIRKAFFIDQNDLLVKMKIESLKKGNKKKLA